MVDLHPINFITDTIKHTSNLLEINFNSFTSYFNFTLFCIVYTIFFFYLASKCKTYYYYKPTNKQLLTSDERKKQYRTKLLLKIPFVKWYFDRKLKTQLNKMKDKLVEGFNKKRDDRKSNYLPNEGTSEQKLRKRIQDWSQKETKIWSSGKVSGSFYTTQPEHFNEVCDFASTYLYQNPLHIDTYKQLSRMQSQILKMTGSLISVNPVFGTITSGGTESLILSIYTYRKYYSNRTKPNIVIPVTAHAAFDKGCYYLNVEARKAKLNDNYEVDLKHMQSLIDSNTIMLVGSAPNYPHGIIDPVKQIGILAKKYDVGMHIDACLGGFILGFLNMDFEGVTSISLDQHKFGLAPKGLSTIFYKKPQYRQHQYFIETQWVGGLYATPTMCGSRSGFASAGGWYSLTHLTKEQYGANAFLISSATKNVAAELRKIPGVEVMGKPQVCVLAFTTKNIVKLYDYLNHVKKWSLALTNRPKTIHISLTLANYQNVNNKLAADVAQGLKQIQKDQSIKQSNESAIYGATEKLPSAQMTDQTLRYILQSTLL